MKLIIAGGRDYVLEGQVSDFDQFMQAIVDQLGAVTEVVSGGAKGADSVGMDWAGRKGIPVRVFAPDWDAYGRAAGPIRNRQMAEYADALVCFPGGKGTASMIREAEKVGLRIFRA